MRILVTGSAGHLGEALVRVLREEHEVAGLDGIVHAATLHKPHVGSHTRQQFVDVNVTGTLTLLEEAVAAGAGRFVFTSTTSAFGRALTPDYEEVYALRGWRMFDSLDRVYDNARARADLGWEPRSIA
jgi:UDP-glucose 4-epimerase